MKRFQTSLLILIALCLCSNALAKSSPFRFAIIGDNRSGDRVYKKIVEGTMKRKPDLVFNTGDIIPNPGNVKQWQNFWNLSKPITVPYYLTPGNHDIDDKKSAQVWKDQVNFPGNETYYSIVYNNNLFVVLNSCEPDHDQKIEGRQLAWLKRVLAKKGYDHKFVFLHHPLFLWQGTSYWKKSMDKYPKLRDALHRLFVQSAVDIVFAGHEHTYKRLDKDGVRYVVTGGAGAPLYSAFNHFMLIDVNGKQIAAKIVDRDGVLRDEFTMGPIQ
ncbi:MAG: metallophosphoesterase [Pseudomonadota bacterium]